MGLGKDGYYTSDDIRKYNAQYNIVLGERSPGKSYRIKADAIRRAWKKQKATMGIIRRYESDLSDMGEYFDDNKLKDKCYGDIEKITDGAYSDITIFRQHIYLSNKLASGKTERGLEIGRLFALSLDERYKSHQYPFIEDIIYEEFVTRSTYLKNEVIRLMNLVSTISRLRNTSVWLVANTISRVCPYFQEWNLKNIPRMKVGSIDTYHYDNTLIAVERCKSREGKKSKMFFGETSKSIQGGDWETRPVPHLSKPYEEYDCLYEMYLCEAGFTFKIELLMNNDADMILYVYPYTKTIKQDIPVITTDFNERTLSRPFLRRNVPAEQKIAALFQDGKTCFASNLCGSDFQSCLSNMKGGLICR